MYMTVAICLKIPMFKLESQGMNSSHEPDDFELKTEDSATE